MAKATRKRTSETIDAGAPAAPERPREPLADRMKRRAEEPGKSEATGIECPSCGSCWHSVYRTSRFFRKVVRYRSCERCGRKFMTTETTGDPPTDSTE
jgi:hypothetical protein